MAKTTINVGRAEQTQKAPVQKPVDNRQILQNSMFLNNQKAQNSSRNSQGNGPSSQDNGHSSQSNSYHSQNNDHSPQNDKSNPQSSGFASDSAFFSNAEETAQSKTQRTSDEQLVRDLSATLNPNAAKKFRTPPANGEKADVNITPEIHYNSRKIDVSNMGSTVGNATIHVIQDDSEVGEGKQEFKREVKNTGAGEFATELLRTSAKGELSHILYNRSAMSRADVRNEKQIETMLKRDFGLDTKKKTPEEIKALLDAGTLQVGKDPASTIAMGPATKTKLEELYTYRSGMNSNMAPLRQIKGYVVDLKASTNVAADFHNNLRRLTQHLEKEYKINISKMNAAELSRALRKGQFHHTGSGVAVVITDKMRPFVEEALFLKKNEGRAKQLGQMGNGLTNTAQFFVKETMREGDAAAGLNVVTTGVKTTKAMGKAGKAVGMAGFDVASFGYNLYGFAQTHGIMSETKHRISTYESMIKKGELKLADGTSTAEALRRNKEFKQQILSERRNYYNRSGLARTEARHPVQWVGKKTKAGLAAGKDTIKKSYAYDRFKNSKLVQSKVGRAASSSAKATRKATLLAKEKTKQIFKFGKGLKLKFGRGKTKIAKSLPVRIIKAPFSAINVVGRTLKKAVVLLGLLILVVSILIILIGQAASSIGAIVPDWGEESTDTIQDVVNDLAAYQNQQLKQLYDFDTASQWSSPVPFPQTWKMTDSTNLSCDLANQEPCAVYEYNQLAGYNLGYYYGPNISYSCKVNTGKWIEEYTETVRKYIGEQSIRESATVIKADAKPENTEERIIENGAVVGKRLTVYASTSTKNVYKKTVTKVIFAHMEEIHETVPGHWATEYKTMTLYGPGGLSGHLGSYDTLSVDIGEGSGLYNELISTKHKNITVKVRYTGSESSTAFSTGAGSSYTNSSGKVIEYSQDDLFRVILSMIYGFTDNEAEGYAYYYTYARRILDAVLEDAVPTLEVAYANTSNGVSWTYTDPDSGFVTECKASKSVPYLTLVLNIGDCGLYDVMRKDWTTDALAHTGSIGRYAVTDRNSTDYVTWDKWFTIDKNRSGGVLYVPTDNVDGALFVYELEDEDFLELYEDLTLPSKMTTTP